MNRRLYVLPAAAILLAAAPADVVGHYSLSGVREAVGGLELRADGTFRYGFSYGALDEQAEGRWRREGRHILLTTDPTPRPPSWSRVAAEPGDPKLFQIMLETMAGQPLPNIQMKIRMADGSVEETQTTQDWVEADIDGKRMPVSVQFHIPVFDVSSPVLPLDPAKARRYRFRLDPADLGVRDFRDWPLEIREDMLAFPDAPGNQGFRKLSP